jgi:hypothetical protein
MWRWRNRNTIYPFISGAGTTALLAFMVATAVLQILAIRDDADANRIATADWRTLMTPPISRDVKPGFSIAFSEWNADAAHRQN